MEQIKPIVVIVDDVEGLSDGLEQGYQNSPVAAYIRHHLDCDVLLYRGIYALDVDWETTQQLCASGIVIAFVIGAKEYVIDGNEIEGLYIRLREKYSEMPMFVMEAWQLENPIVLHDGDLYYHKVDRDQDLIRLVKYEKVDFMKEGTTMSRNDQLQYYRKVEEAIVMPSSEIAEYANLKLEAQYVADFRHDADVLRSMSDEGVAAFEKELDFAKGVEREGDYYRVVRGVGMGEHCASFAANSLTRDIYMSTVGRNHGISQMRMLRLVERLLELGKDLEQSIEATDCIGGYVYHHVGDFKTPILVMNWPMGDDEESHRIVGKFVFDCKIALPVDRSRKLIE